jgi:hypothetical protein
MPSPQLVAQVAGPPVVVVPTKPEAVLQTHWYEPEVSLQVAFVPQFGGLPLVHSLTLAHTGLLAATPGVVCHCTLVELVSRHVCTVAGEGLKPEPQPKPAV